MSQQIELVAMMAAKFGLEYQGVPRFLSEEEKGFRLTCLCEEVSEYHDATTRADEFDALLDLMVFTIGTMLRQGFPIVEGFQRVMTANMNKECAMVRTASKRNFELDLIKPFGWVSPDLSDLTGDKHVAKRPS